MNGEPHQRLGRTAQPGSLRLIGRGLRLRCPACGRGKLFRGWFAMHECCARCGREFRRGPGYLLGSIYFNYGVTASIVIVMFFGMFFADLLDNSARLAILIGIAVLFPLWFFRYARALWIAFDERWDPWPNAEETRRSEAAWRVENSP